MCLYDISQSPLQVTCIPIYLFVKTKDRVHANLPSLKWNLSTETNKSKNWNITKWLLGRKCALESVGDKEDCHSTGTFYNIFSYVFWINTYFWNLIFKELSSWHSGELSLTMVSGHWLVITGGANLLEYILQHDPNHWAGS